MSRVITYTTVACALGRLLVATTSRGVCHVAFGDGDAELAAALRLEFPFAVLAAEAPNAGCAANRIVRALESDSPLDLPLDVRGSRFQRRVWSALRAIPRGTTRTYGEVAESLGQPGAARAVARACAANPVVVVVPCHRIVPRSGGAGGYRYGTWRKQALLASEANLGSRGSRPVQLRRLGMRTR